MSRPVILVIEGLSASAKCVREAGGDALDISVYDRDSVEICLEEGVPDGIVLTGGGDVDPRRYGEQPLRTTYGVSEDRDDVEFFALRFARAYNIPVLGICRGSQVMNVEAGGSLWQHIQGKGKSHLHRNGNLKVGLKPGSKVRKSFNGANVADTTHLHHQAVRKPGHGLMASAWHADGTIEAIESTSGPWKVGVQFHPEYEPYDDPARGLFRQLVIQAAKSANLPVPRKRRLWTPPPAPITTVASAPEWDVVLGPSKREPIRPEPYDFDFCHLCTIFFDEEMDAIDHMYYVHGIRILGGPSPSARGFGNTPLALESH